MTAPGSAAANNTPSSFLPEPALRQIRQMLDDAELKPMERLRLTRELANIRSDLAKGPVSALAKLKLASRLAEVRKALGFGKPAPPPLVIEPKPPAETDGDTDSNGVQPFGLQASGIKTRERLNSQVRGILERVQAQGMRPEDLTAEDREVLAQYSGRGGLTDNSQSEYYTPTHVASATWDLLSENGFSNGNVLEPSTGAGVFSATKPAGVLISGAEIDPTSSAVAQLLHPEDKITNSSFERFALSQPDDTFDAVNGNVPFGVRGAERHHDLAFKSEKRMERYFVRRVLDKVRPGGLVVLIVPTSVIGKKDKGWQRWRAEISMLAEFLGGHKLPSKTFGKQGTDVVTDIIVLRKHPAALIEKLPKLPLATLKASRVLWDEWLEGRYFQGEGARFIHGTFVPGDPTAARSEDKVIAPPDLTDEALRRKIAARFDSRIDWDLLETTPEPVRAYAEGDRKVINGEPMEMKDGKWVPFVATEEADIVLDKALMGAATLAELESMLATPDAMLAMNADQAFRAWKRFPHLFTGVQAQAVEFAMSQPADRFRDVAYRGSLLGAMVTKYGIGDDATDRDRVIGLLRAELVKYGHPTKINGMVLTGAKAQAFGTYLSAIDSDGNLSAVVTGGVAKAKGYKSDDILSIVAHLARQSADAIDLEAIKALYDGQRALNDMGDIADVSGIAITAHGEVMVIGAYCCGDVYEKVGQLQNAIAGSADKRINAHWTDLIANMMGKVKRTEVSNIGFGLRDNWIDARYKVEFLRINGYGDILYQSDAPEPSEDDGEEVVAARAGGAWVYRGKSEFNKQLSKYLAGMSIGHGLRDRQDATAAERSAEYQEKVQGLEEQFKFFMQAHGDATDLAATYDMTFNRHVTPEYDDSDLGLRGVSPNVKTHGFQNSGVRRLSDEGGGILGFDVGLGKTFSSLAFSVYDRQMGRSKKHCTVVPKSVLANWYMESKKMLGTHEGVLFVGFEPKRNKAGQIVTEPVMDENNKPKRNQHTGEVEYQDVLVEDSPEEVYAKMHSIPAMTGGLVIMTQEKFKTIPLKPETKEAYGDKWVERSMTSAANAERLAGKEQKEGSYAKQKQKAGLEGTFYEEGTKKKDELPFFEDMKFDRVIVDEAHHYKASFQVKEGMDKLAYLPNPAESQRAQDMALKLSHVRDQNSGKGAILLTATPVANSPIEIYNMLMHVVPPEELDKIGVYTPADFVRFFGQIESVQKLTVAGVIEPRDGLKGFRNLNILRGLFNRYANMMGAKDVDPEGSVLKLPDAQEVKSQCDMTSTQQDAYITLRDEAKKAGNPKNVAAGLARPMFAVLRDMDRVTTDIDLYNKEMTFLFRASEESKVKAMIEALPATADRVEVDEDTGEKVTVKVPKVTTYRVQGDTLTYVAPESFEYAIASRLQKFGIGYASHPLTPKYAELVKNLKAEMSAGGKQLIFTEEKSQHGKLERLLVENLPEEETRIGIINADTASGEKLQEIVDAYTRGDYTIIICNKKAEVGVNLQRGTTAVHHMTLPWNPASIQQRNGRAVRQGNKVSSVRIYYYQAKGSFDEYRLDLLSKKAGWINALLSKDNTEDEHDNENAGSDIEQAALLSDNREEFLAKLAEQQAKKDAARKEQRDSAAKLGLGQLAAARDYLKTFDSRKAKALADAQAELDKAVASLQRAKDAPNPDPAEQTKTVDRRTAEVQRAQRRLASVAPDLDKKRSDAEARARQLSGTLRAQAGRGELPFSPKLIDAPEESLMTMFKLVVAVGGIYEVPEKGRGTGVNVLRVTAVDRVNKTVTVEYLSTAQTGYFAARDGDEKLETLFTQAAREVHFNDAEVQAMKLLKEPLTYINIGKMVSRDVFEANVSRVRVKGYNLVRMPTGELTVGYDMPGSGNVLVYPDREGRALREEVGALWAKSFTDSYSLLTSHASDIMPAIFGEDWKAAMQEFAKTAGDEDIRTKALSVIRGRVPEVPATLQQAQDAMRYLDDARRDYGKLASPYAEVRAWAAQEGFLNLDRMVSLTGSAIAAELARVMAQVREMEDAAKRAADAARQAAERSDPRFKELTDAQIARFAKMGVKAQYNNGDNLPGWGQYAVLTLKDTRAKGGVLYAMKEMMKPRFGAKFIGSKSVGYGSPYSDTWGVPARTDVDALLAFLEA